MLITFKTTTKESFKMELTADETIGQVKAKLQAEKNYAPELTKLIYAGKVLTDDMTVASINFDEEKFIAVMVVKPNATPVVDAAAVPPVAADALEEIIDNIEFQQLCQKLRANPQLMQPMMQAMAQNQPVMAAQINANKEAFIQMLNVSQDDEEEDDAMVDGIMGALGGGAGANPQAVQIQLTPEEATAIDGLKSMGFPEQLCLEAYLACDKNADLAVNYILARMDEFQDDLNQQLGGGGGGAGN